MTDRLYEAFHKPSSPDYQVVERAVFVLIAISILQVGLDLAGKGDHPALQWVDNIVAALFALEIVFRVALFRPRGLSFYELNPHDRVVHHITGRIGYCLQPLTMVDIVAVMSWVPALRGLRALRLLRLLRTTRFFRYSSPFLSVQRAFQDNALLYSFAVSFVGAVTLLGGVSIYFVEGPPAARLHVNDPLWEPTVHTLADGFWWAIVTLTTVGFGDIAPHSGLGRIVAAVIMLLGMFTLALFAGIVGNTLLRAVLSIRQEQFRMSTELDHVVVFGYSARARMLLDALMAENDFDQTGVTVMGPGERPAELPPQFRWVQGDPTKESELHKVRMSHAAAVLVVGSGSDRPQIADATSILTVFTIRRYAAENPPSNERRRPLYVVAEILESENVDHARAAGADEVIETTRMGFSVLAHAISEPGTAHVISKVATADSASLYVGRAPDDVELPSSFGELHAALRERYPLLLLGIRDAKGHEHLNPRDDFVVQPTYALIYLADGALLPSTA